MNDIFQDLLDVLVSSLKTAPGSEPGAGAESMQMECGKLEMLKTGQKVGWAWLQHHALCPLELYALDFRVSKRDRSYLPLRRVRGSWKMGARVPRGEGLATIFSNGPQQRSNKP